MTAVTFERVMIRNAQILFVGASVVLTISCESRTPAPAAVPPAKPFATSTKAPRPDEAEGPPAREPSPVVREFAKDSAAAATAEQHEPLATHVDNETFIASIEDRFSFDRASDSDAPAQAVARIGDDVDPKLTTLVQDCAAFFDAVHRHQRETVRFGKTSFEVSPRRIVSQGRTLYASESDCDQPGDNFSAVVGVHGAFAPYVNVAAWEEYVSSEPCDGQDDENVTCSTSVSTVELRVVDSRNGMQVTFEQLFDGTTSEFHDNLFNVATWDAKQGRARIVGGRQWQNTYPYPGVEEWVTPHPKVAPAIASAHRAGVLRPNTDIEPD